ncbi:uncharacterized protein LOC122322805 [Drosophila grimshawi]|uniref:uncharacterized protein LOC122322805 n=1 Tax=Drosophila grimshawi TaxID=7222 RepID=UPI001C9326AA|nr:uncharacterized protein LOC122322805 [Drosophila grimshawi]
MSTINRRIKVKFRNAEPEITTFKKQDSILKCIRSSSNFNPDHDLDPDRGVNALKKPTTKSTVQTVLKQCYKYETNRDKMLFRNWHYQQRNRANYNMLLGVLFTLLLCLNCSTQAILMQEQDGVGVVVDAPGSALNNTGYRNGAIIKAANATTGLIGSSSSSSSSSSVAARQAAVIWIN